MCDVSTPKPTHRQPASDGQKTDDQAIARIKHILDEMPASSHRNSAEYLLEMLEAKRAVDAQKV